MGWALEHMTESQRRRIAATLFTVTEGEESGEWMNGLCPLHEDSNPSFGYCPAKDIFKCLANCVESGDLVKLYCLVNGLDDKDGFKAFVEQFSPEHVVKKGKGPSKGNIIPEEVWERCKPLPPSWVTRLQELRGWSPEVMEIMDLRIQSVFQGKDGQVRDSTSPDRVALPVRDRAGHLRNIRLYKPGAKVRKIMSWGKGFGKNRLFPPAPLYDGQVILCEGESDTLCALSQGLNAITQTGKPNKWDKDQIEALRGRDVVIAYDADQPGQRYAAKAADNLVQVAKSVRLLEWPHFMGRLEDGWWPKDGGQDLTDFFVRHKKTAKDFQELVLQAREHDNPNPPQVEDGITEFFVRGLNGRLSFKPRLLADKLIKDVPILHDPDTGVVYRWNNKFWEPYNIDHIKRLAVLALGTESDQGRVNDATFQAKVLSNIPADRAVNDMEDWLCLQNGMLNIDTGEFKPHAKDYYATIALDVEYNPKSTKDCSRWLQFLDETIQTPDVIDFIQEFFGYCLTRSTAFGIALFLLGPGSDGKSVMLKVLRTLVGAANCSAVALADLEDQFHRASLHNKLVNISTETGAKAIESPYFKAMVTGDAISAAYKHHQPFEFEPVCKQIFAGNQFPRVRDNTFGVLRRLKIIRFKQQFVGDRIDRGLTDKLLDELSEIFLWALAGLFRLLKQGHFTESQELDSNLLKFKRANNPVLCFVEDCCATGESYSCLKDDLFKEYKSFCSSNGYSPRNKENFFRELQTVQENLSSRRPRENGRRVQRLDGIQVVSEAAVV
jgi:putative DNA primase/helicase